MPFDPVIPPNGAPTSSAVMRSQLTGLLDLIQTIPVGPAGPPGPPGISVSGAVVDGVTTVPAGGAATAGTSFDGANVRFTFGLPRGEVGETGAPGGPGPQGIQGEVGPPGPPFTSFNVASTTTLDPAPFDKLRVLDNLFDGRRS
ncbi:MAG TPA: hypothetical protein VGO11_08590 [Chthoniobacteraceae bacterium]|jgi:hypothetical protein|nr:hypothetical protein [Chthoniobacteraceae bacterium]